jgi:hypothetical protein
MRLTLRRQFDESRLKRRRARSHRKLPLDWRFLKTVSRAKDRIYRLSVRPMRIVDLHREGSADCGGFHEFAKVPDAIWSA